MKKEYKENRMKSVVTILFALIFFASVPDSSGCHTCRTNCSSWGLSYGEYHCHGGGTVNPPVQNIQPIQQQVIQQPTSTPYILPIPTYTPIPTLTPTPKSKYIETEMDKKKMFLVTSVVDGDTIKTNIRGKIETIRLLGIDTPETVDPRKAVQCFGKEASNKMKALVTGKYIKLIDDRTQGNRDKYGRLLRYLYDGNLFINAEMVKQGYAFSYKQYPTKYLDEFNKLEKQARENNLGLWKSCPI
jgi:micrococcal nuclease